MNSQKCLLNDDIETISQLRGKRLMILRKMVNLTRLAMERKHNINANTLQSWESAKAGGLGLRGAKRVIEALKRDGVFCTVDWLLHGVGAIPHVVSTDEVELDTNKLLPEKEIIMQELQEFYAKHRNAIDMRVKDDCMSPYFNPGDIAAGEARMGNAIDALIGVDCIVQLPENRLVLRRVKRSTKPGVYDLVPINADSNVLDTVLLRQHIIKAAPAVWLRKADTSRSNIDDKSRPRRSRRSKNPLLPLKNG